MISDPNLVLYACVSKGATILAEYTSGEPDLETLASKCLENTPPFHSMFSHTIRKRTYTFLIDGPNPFVYFAIFDESLDKLQGIWFLNRIKDVLGGIMERDSIHQSDNLNQHCFQAELSPIFRELLVLRIEAVNLVQSALTASRNGSLDSQKGKKVSRGLKKKKRLSGENNDIVIENKLDVSVDNGNLTRDFSVSLHKNGMYVGDGGRQKAKQIWRRHVWVVLLIDLFVCSLLFGIWLGICRGFKCVNG